MVLRKMIKSLPYGKELFYARRNYHLYKKEYDVTFSGFLRKKFGSFKVIPYKNNKAEQTAKLFGIIDIAPIDNADFFYSIDCFKTLESTHRVLDNCTIDYNYVVNSSLKEITDVYLNDDIFSNDEFQIINALKGYVERIKEKQIFKDKYHDQILALSSLFERPAHSMFEALQRILFINQFAWQTGRTHNGLGRLDIILDRVYKEDLASGRTSKERVFSLLCSFISALHEYYWFKSNLMLGDTGQIIILGGKNEDGSVFCNDLTTIFIEVVRSLRLTEPKVLLRYSKNTSDDLFDLSIDTISTGLGEPLLSNDDVIIPALVEFGYSEKESFNYITAACWEPQMLQSAGDHNNIACINFVYPFISLLDREPNELDSIQNIDSLIDLYLEQLKKYLDSLIEPLTRLQFEEDPFVSLFSESSLVNHRDIVRGAGLYNNLGLTSVGLGNVVNSFISINQLVFISKKYKLSEINTIRKNNFTDNEDVLQDCKNTRTCFGDDDEQSIELSKKIINEVSIDLSKFKTFYNGKFKFGLSSPNYITDSRGTEATLDGRKNGEAFDVHISSSKAIPITSLFNFSAALGYKDNKFNGNVTDCIIPASFMKNNIKKISKMIRVGLDNGISQMQFNVLDSRTLIEAKKDPNKFPNLIVRVWGFSAYFNDLPDEYKDVLIKRAILSESGM